ncbi:MAG TPA: YqiA/YcfP family alpha/beta fold hydrolase [Rhodocyclaceae bacterium]|nr:YqiA/YcfP family alpha/beta fold hydrolase [Rhodocyclaceae bacterium]
MGRPVILYLHGFCSSPSSWKARLLGERMAAMGLADCFHCPALSPVPEEAIATAETIIKAANGPVTLVGSSLGGHYATHLAEKHDLEAVLVNPAVIHRLDLDIFIGEHDNFHTGEHFSFTREHAGQLLAQVVPHPTPSRYLLMVETGDEVLDWRHAAEHYAGCRQVVLEGGDHSFTKFPEYISQIIEFTELRAGL